MFGEDEEESVRRAQFLMSPYNITEARRCKNKRLKQAVGLITLLLLSLLALVYYFHQ